MNCDLHFDENDIDFDWLQDNPITNDNRFLFITEEEKTSFMHSTFSVNTMRKIDMVVKLFNEWRNARNLVNLCSVVPVIDIDEWCNEDLNIWIPYFINEIRKKDGSKYKAKTIFEYCMCLQSFLFVKKNIRLQFLKDQVFVPIYNSLDNLMKRYQSEGLGNNPVRCDIISDLNEDDLWCSGLLGSSNPGQLLHTTVYILGIFLALRTGEHRMLRRDMFKVINYKFLCIIILFILFRLMLKASISYIHRIHVKTIMAVLKRGS
jgi:hypothetical protein